MKNIFAVMVLAFASLAFAQGNPPPVASYILSGGKFVPAPTTASLGAISYNPPPAALYCFNSSTKKWVPADSSCFGGGGGGGVTWPTSGDVVVSNGTNSPSGLAPVNGDCVVGAGGVWTVGGCGSGISGGTSGQVAVFGSASTITSGIPVGSTGNDILQLTGGLIAASVIPTPTGSSLGGVESSSGATHTFANAMLSSGTLQYAQPAFTDISGNLGTGQGPTAITNILYDNAGTLQAATGSEVNTLIQGLTGCNTASNVYTPQSGTCVAPSGGTSVTAAPPYVEIGSTFYDHDFYAVTKPVGFSSGCTFSSSFTWLNSVTPTTCTNGTNGNVLIQTTSSIVAWASESGSSSVECVFNATSNMDSGFVGSGCWIYDSTNGKIYVLEPEVDGTGIGSYQMYLAIYTCTSPCTSANPSFSSNALTALPGAYGFGSNAHLKLSVASTTLTAAICLDGGASACSPLITESVGTITKGGYMINGASSVTLTDDIMSILVQ